MPSATDYIYQKALLPAQLRTKEWNPTPKEGEDKEKNALLAQLRERAFFMASVEEYRELAKWHDIIARVTAGEMDARTARERMREWLEHNNYTPDAGLEGTIKDRSSVQRMQVAIDTNVAMARAWAERNEALDNVLAPGWELYRQQTRMQPRDWQTRWQLAATKVGWAGVARDGSMVALVTSPIWRELSVFKQPHPPFDYNSGMYVRPVDFEECERLGLVRFEDMDALEAEMQAQKVSLNEDVKVELDGKGQNAQLVRELEQIMGGLARAEQRQDGTVVLLMNDLNGTTPVTSEALAKEWAKPLPEGSVNLQKKALEDFTMDNTKLTPHPKLKPHERRPGLDEMEDLARLMKRLTPARMQEPLYRAVHFHTEAERDDFIRRCQKTGVYTPLPGRVADSWSTSMRNTMDYARKDNFYVILVLKTSTQGRDIRPFYETMKHKEQPGKPLMLEAEVLFDGNKPLVWVGATGASYTYEVKE